MIISSCPFYAHGRTERESVNCLGVVSVSDGSRSESTAKWREFSRWGREGRDPEAICQGV